MLNLPMLLGAFQPPGPARFVPGAENQELAGILLCPAPSSTFSAAIQARFRSTLPSNLYLRVMQPKEGTWEGFTATYRCKPALLEGHEDIRTAIVRDKQSNGRRRAKKLNLIRTIDPECKDLAQTWGRKMITVHEEIYP